jgi:2-desacetyl-2-hydroxyethyl bacteriochlorophyllide A dehydrogenase
VLGVHVDGGMRDTISMPLTKLHRSRTLRTEQLALVETLGIGSHAIDRARIEPGERVLVIGVGPIGLSVIQFAKLAGAELTVLDLNESRLRFCREQFGVERTIGPAEMPDGDPLEALRDFHDGELPTMVFDVTGHSASMMRSFELVASGGKLVFVGLFIGDVTFHDPDFHRKEITLLSSRNSRPQDFRRIIDLMERGEIDTAPWITHRASFDDLIDSFPGWLEPDAGVVKAVLEIRP